MEDDDEFGDLYSDVLPNFTTSVQSQLADTGAFKSSQNRPIDLGVASDDEEILYGAPQLNNSSSGLGVELDASIQLGEEARPDRGGFDSNLDAAMGLEEGDEPKLPEKGTGKLNFMEDDDDDLNIVVEELEQKDDEFMEKDDKFFDKQGNVCGSAERNANVIGYVVDAGMGSEQIIPETSGKPENHGGHSLEDEWESDESEDDLQIVLNDNHMAADDEDGEALMIVADDGDVSHGLQQEEMEVRERGDEEGGRGADVERKESGEAAKTSGGGGGGTAATTSVQPKIGYSNHMYHQPCHSQFKYVRPGAASTSGAASLNPGGAPGQVRPPITLGAIAGRGRGDWQPAGVKGAIPMQMGLQPGNAVPVQGGKAAFRGHGSGLDFTLPSHKTIFEVDIDRFEEKPWRIPGIDVSDFFNFSLNEESWKEYCNKLEQLRLETSMQSKIRVYESGRAEQGHDPDLPPELAAAAAAAVGIPSENAGATDLPRGSGRPPLPIGRPIPVETGSGDRVPSIDTRRPRMHDSDVVIEITCQSSADDDDPAEQQDDDPAEEDEVHDLQQDDADHIHRLSHAYNGQNRKLVARMEQLKNMVNRDEIGREDSLHVVSEAAGEYQPDNPPHEESDYRSAKGRGHVKISKMTANANSGEKKHVINYQNESFDSETGKLNPQLSSSLVIGSDGEQIAAVDDNDVSVTEDRSFDAEREDTALGATTKQKRISEFDRVSQENDDRENSKPSRSSGNSEVGTGSSKDQRKFHDTLKDEGCHHPPTRNSKRSVGDEDDAHRSRRGRDEIRNHGMAVKEKEDSRLRRGGDSDSLLHRPMKSESAEWRKESDDSERSWRRRDEGLHERRNYSGEIGSTNRDKARESQSGNREKHHPHDQKTGSRQRNWDDNLKTQNEKADDRLNKRRKEGVKYNQREGSSHRNRERDNSSDQRRTDDNTKVKDDGMHNVRQKREESHQKERSGRQRDHDEWRRHKQLCEESLPRKEREEKQSVMRSGRPVEDKIWNNHSQKSDVYGRSGREYHSRDVGRHGEQLGRMNQIESESFPQYKVHEDAHVHGNQGSNDVTRGRYKRVDRSDIHQVPTSHTSRLYERRQNKESEIGDHGSLISAKKNKEEPSGQISEKANSRSMTKQGSDEDDVHVNRQALGKHGEEASADGFDARSRRGRSKSEHQTSHKERDFGVTAMLSSSLKKSRDAATHDQPPHKVEENRQPSVDDREEGGEMNNAITKVDNHFDTVEKLKKRSERFKLAKPREKEAVATKSEALSSSQTENHANSAVKTERPARKRRWRGD